MILFVSCNKENFDISNINGNEIDVLGHAGMGISNLYPINSLESISNCLFLEADGSEMDVQMTKDSVLVCFHDEDLSHSTNLSGTIHALTWDELKDAQYTSAPYSSYPIRRVSEVMSTLEIFLNKTYTFDIKLYPEEGADIDGYMDAFAESVVLIFNQFDLKKKVYIESQNPDFLNRIQTSQPEYRLYFYPQTFDEGLNVVTSNNFQGISISTNAINVEQVQQAHDAGIYVTIWGVQSKDENTEAIRKNPDMIQTDKVEYLVKLLN